MNIAWGNLQTAASNLARAKQDAFARVAQCESRKRESIVTPILGQELLYLAQAAEARTFLGGAKAKLTESEFPMLFEAAKSGTPAKEIAETWLSKSTDTSKALARLETTRRQVISAINSAETLEQLESALADYMTQE